VSAALSVRAELETQLDVLASLALPNPTIAPADVGAMVAALVALAPPCHAPSAARVCRFVVRACAQKPSAAAYHPAPPSLGPASLFPRVSARASAPAQTHASLGKGGKGGGGSGSSRRGEASPSPATYDAGLGDRVAAAAAAASSLATAGPLMGGYGGGCLLSETADIGRVSGWLLNVLEFAQSAEAQDVGGGGLAKDALRALAQVERAFLCLRFLAALSGLRSLCFVVSPLS
jgi:hypothetical protein